MKLEYYTKLTFVMVAICAFVVPITAGVILLNMYDTIDREVSPEEFEKIKQDIQELESVNVFKETYPGYREETILTHDVEYTIQARNENTGMVLSLDVYHNDYRDRASKVLHEHLNCLAYEDIMIGGDFYRFDKDATLFISEQIKNSKCLDDDYTPKLIKVDAGRY